jgi:hypothetical protein
VFIGNFGTLASIPFRTRVPTVRTWDLDSGGQEMPEHFSAPYDRLRTGARNEDEMVPKLK